MAKSFSGVHAAAVAGMTRGNSRASSASTRPAQSRQSLGALASNINSSHYRVANMVQSYFRKR